jgi:hypothetical protein
MSRYKFHTDRKSLPDEEIEKMKDFRKVVFRYEKAGRPLYKFPLYRYKNRKVWMAVFLVLLVVYLIIMLS